MTENKTPDNVMAVYECEYYLLLRDLRNQLVEVVAEVNKVAAVAAMEALLHDVLDTMEQSDINAANYIRDQFLERRVFVDDEEEPEGDE